MPQTKRLRVSHHVIFWKNKISSSMSKVFLPLDPSTNFSANLSIDLFLEESNPSASIDHFSTHQNLLLMTCTVPKILSRLVILPLKCLLYLLLPPNLIFIGLNRQENHPFIFEIFIVFLLSCSYMNLSPIKRPVLILFNNKLC